MQDDIVHGVDGWVLETFEWSPTTGVGHFTYGRTVGEEKKYEKVFVNRRQPAEPKHEGWRT